MLIINGVVIPPDVEAQAREQGAQVFDDYVAANPPAPAEPDDVLAADTTPQPDQAG